MKSKSARVNGDSKRALTSMQQVSQFRIVYSVISVLWIIQMLSAKNWRRHPFPVFTGYTGYKQNHLVPASYHFLFQIMFCWIRKAHLHCLHWTYTHSLHVKSSSIVVGREKLLTGVTNDFLFSSGLWLYETPAVLTLRDTFQGCVYLKCDTHHSAGLAFRSLHGCWFDGKLCEYFEWMMSAMWIFLFSFICHG